MAISSTPLSGVLHVHVAFDWGDEIDLAKAQTLAPAEEYPLVRRRRTPASIAFRPPPLRLHLSSAPLELAGLGLVPATAEVTLYDFAAVSVELQAPFTLPAEALLHLAGTLAENERLVATARDAARDLFARLSPAIKSPAWSELTEEYVVFRFAPQPGLPPAAELRREWSGWLAGLARLESDPLGAEEIAESLRLASSYGENDVVVPEWSAAVLVDNDCEETLQVMELANVQLLEFRFLDNRLDDELARAYKLIRPLARSWLPFWRTQMRPLRAMGQMKVEAHALFDRTTNVLKLVGDHYLARLYGRLASRFHLHAWSQSIRDSLAVVEEVYEVVADQSATYRTELLEITVVALIVFEIVMAFWGH